MFDTERIAGFEWDDGNRRKSEDKHGVTQAEAEQVFLNEPLLVVEDTAHSQSESRYHALGKTDAGRPLHVTFALRDEATRIRIISARPMHRKEKSRYAQEG
ncbi:MAG: BrnT family toxin [Rhodospirillales bacterium]|nr:BrnT family toxin [Rhodospirillales bacterium]